VEFAEGFPEGGGVAEIAAGEDNPIGDAPVARVHHFDDDGFLAFDAERVDGVERDYDSPSRRREIPPSRAKKVHSAALHGGRNMYTLRRAGPMD